MCGEPKGSYLNRGKIPFEGGGKGEDVKEKEEE